MRNLSPEAVEQLRQAEMKADRLDAEGVADRARKTIATTDLELAELELKRRKIDQRLEQINLEEQKVRLRRTRAEDRLTAALAVITVNTPPDVVITMEDPRVAVERAHAEGFTAGLAQR